jgi:cell division protein FtsW
MRIAAMDSTGVDKVLLFVILALVLIGLVMVYSSSYEIARESTRTKDPSFFLRNHVVRIMLGFALLFIFARAGENSLRAFAVPLVLLSLVLLVLTLVPNPLRLTVRGSSRWLGLGPFSFQPSEIAKIGLILYLADFAARKGEDMKRFKRGFLPGFAAIGVTVGLIALEPNVGTAGMLLAIGCVVLFAAGANPLHIAGGLCASAATIATAMWATGYNWGRIFIDSGSASKDVGYQLWQSLIAIGAGGLGGAGIGMSNQKYLFLPDAHTDFVFAIMAEEIGFLGMLAVIGLFAVFLWRGLRIAHRAQTAFSSVVASGITMGVVGYFCANAAVCTGIFPTAGLPLPFVSYGGSSSMILLASCGILLGISRRRPSLLDRQPDRWRALVK